MTGEQPLPSALVQGIQQLEPMPVTAQRLLAMMNGEDVSLARIAELVEFDQAIAATCWAWRAHGRTPALALLTRFATPCYGWAQCRC